MPAGAVRPPRPTRIDHLVLYATDVDATCTFYERLGLERREFDGGRVALHLGDAKLNVHPAGDEYDPHAAHPTPGAADFCLTVADLDAARDRLADAGIEVIEDRSTRPAPAAG
ncbi:MAG: VOC family protein [Haloferacaceae archaeon]